MRGNNILGILFANVHDEKVHELTEVRTLASAPFGGRYRLIDFPLSNMVNSGINKVGVITNNNYQSLLDHLGSGKAWDLSRKREGLYILPPFDFRPYYVGADIRKGMEIGIWGGMFNESMTNLDEADRAVNAFDHDFIIGSFHCMRQDDLYRYDFANADRPSELEDFYAFMHESLRKFMNFDVLGHFSIIDRYIGEILDYSPVEDIIDEILKLLINNGRGIEINTSSFKYGTGIWLPRESILRRYHELGGEILTFGSDAHEPQYYRYHFNDAVQLAANLGFRYYCTFKNRTPEFHRMPL